MPVTTVVLLDHPVTVRQALRAGLSLTEDLVILGEADDAAPAVSLARALEPDVVVVDAETPDLDCPSLVRDLAEHDPTPGIVILSVHTVAISQALAGTRATVVGKHEGLRPLVRAIHSAARRSRLM